MLHVELIQNEWSAGQQHVVARLILSGAGVVSLESNDEETWRPIVLKPFVEPDAGHEISPESEPELFLRSLHKHLAGDYLFATEAHEAGECDYPVGQMLPLSVSNVSMEAHVSQ